MLRPYNSPFPPEASEHVILSAAGAKDLLSPRCEGRALCPHAPSVLKQVLRSRAFRALAQDDTPPRALKKEQDGTHSGCRDSRTQPLISFSRAIAARTSANRSK